MAWVRRLAAASTATSHVYRILFTGVLIVNLARKLFRRG